jgi:hypothetical protein
MAYSLVGGEVNEDLEGERQCSIYPFETLRPRRLARVGAGQRQRACPESFLAKVPAWIYIEDRFGIRNLRCPAFWAHILLEAGA